MVSPGTIRDAVLALPCSSPHRGPRRRSRPGVLAIFTRHGRASQGQQRHQSADCRGHDGAEHLLHAGVLHFSDASRQAFERGVDVLVLDDHARVGDLLHHTCPYGQQHRGARSDAACGLFVLLLASRRTASQICPLCRMRLQRRQRRQQHLCRSSSSSATAAAAAGGGTDTGSALMMAPPHHQTASPPTVSLAGAEIGTSHAQYPGGHHQLRYHRAAFAAQGRRAAAFA